VAVLLAGLLVWQGSNAAFSAQTHNNGNNWETGTVALTDDDAGTAMFGLANMVPMQTGSRCITVTADTSVPGGIKTDVPTLTIGGLENYLDVVIEQGSGGSFAGGCSGFVNEQTEASQTLTNLYTDHHDYTNAVDHLFWNKAAGVESRTFKITWTFNTTSLTVDQVNALQGKDVGAVFEWELRNN